MATRSSILAWRIPWREEPGRLQSMGSQRVRHDWSDSACTHIPLSISRVLSPFQTETAPINSLLPFPLDPPGPAILLSVSINLTRSHVLGESCSISHFLIQSFWLISLSITSSGSPSCSLCQNFLSFQGWIIFHCGLPRWHSGEESICQCGRCKRLGLDLGSRSLGD